MGIALKISFEMYWSISMYANDVPEHFNPNSNSWGGIESSTFQTFQFAGPGQFFSKHQELVPNLSNVYFTKRHIAN